MDKLTNYNYINNLSYKDAAQLDDQKLQTLIYEAKQNLFGQILSDKNNNVLPFDKAYRFQVKLINDMDIVAKCEEIPILETVIKTPDMYAVPIHYKKLNLKQRLQVLFKGEI